MQIPRFDNAFVRDLPADPRSDTAVRQVEGALYSVLMPTPVAAPRLLAYAPEVAELLDFDAEDMSAPRMIEMLGGNALLEGMQPYASNYGGHQFGHWAGQLGDGRAVTLGEMVNADGQRWELQLKGAGMTPYSRGADGRAVLRSSIREFLCSEAMHHLGIPTTRALSLVGTGEQVVRDMFYDGHPRPEPGAIVCRVAPSFIRFGHFELPASRGDTGLLRRLVDFTIQRDFPHLHGHGDTLIGDWFGEICERTAHMIAHWMRVGFVHGVMNTDNMSVLGQTIDYGPYGWLENFDPGWTPNTTDAHGRRYRFGHQPQVAFWNLSCLAGALAPLCASTEPLEAGLERYRSTFEVADRDNVARKLGLRVCGDDDMALMQQLHTLLTDAEVDMTLFFRALADVDPQAPDMGMLHEAFYDPAKRDAYADAFNAWLRRHAARVRAQQWQPTQRRARMQASNPRYVLRNYLAQEAIDSAEQGDMSRVHDLLDVMRHPYDDQTGRDAFARRRPEWARNKAGCSMLSCSS